jgi:hypothetical protein
MKERSVCEEGLKWWAFRSNVLSDRCPLRFAGKRLRKPYPALMYSVSLAV